MGIVILLALLAAAAAGGGDKKKSTSAPATPPKTPSDDAKGDAKGPEGTDLIFPTDEPSDEVWTPKPASDTKFSATSDSGMAARTSLKNTARTFTDLSGSPKENPAAASGDWPGIHGLPQPHRNLALNVTKDVIYRTLNTGGPACWSGTCSSEAISGAIKAIDAAIDLTKYPDARRELWAALYRLRNSGK